MIPVWLHLKNGQKVKRALKRDHVCTKKCLHLEYAFGLTFASCKRYSYRPEGEKREKEKQSS